MFLRVLVNLFWCAFLTDGLLSVADEVLSLQGGVSSLGLIRSIVALGVLLLSLLMAGLLVFSPRLPKRMLGPMLLFIWWAGPAQAFPLNHMSVEHLLLWVSLGQVAVAAAVLGVFRLLPTDWRLPFGLRTAPSFSWKHAMVAAPVVGLILTGFAGVALYEGLTTEIQSLTGGYVRLKPDGIYLVERRFASGDREVRLAGMMHVADQSFYSSVLPPVDPAFPSVVLVEGVTDSQRLLGRRALRYGQVARVLNLASQEESSFTRQVVHGLDKTKAKTARHGKKNKESAQGTMDFKHADVDVATFDPRTIAFIVAVTGLFQAESWRDVMHALADPASPLNDEGAQTQVMQDILYGRNERLTGEIEISLKDYRRVIVPWGALHLPEVESWLRARDFVQSGEVERKAFGFW